MTLGVRPESLSVDGAGNSLMATVDLVETLGSTRAVYAMMARVEAPVCAIVPSAHAARPGTVIQLRFPPGDAYLFDASGRAFARSGAVTAAA